jgi:hypothetical protein
VVVNDGITFREFLKRLAENYDCIFPPQKLGDIGTVPATVQWVVLDWAGFPAAATALDYNLVDRESYQNWYDMAVVNDNIKFNYWYNYAKNYYIEAYYKTAATAWDAVDGEMNLQYWGSDRTTALEVATNRINLMKNPRLYHQFDVPFEIGRALNPGTPITCTFQDGYYHGTSRCVLVLKQTIMPGSMRVRLVGVDVTLINAGW